MSDRKLIRLASLALVAVALMAMQMYAARDVPVPIPEGAIRESPLQNDTVATSTNALVVRAVDGDTLVVRIDGEQDDVKVRMLGIDTPESVDPRTTVECFGKEASKRTAELTTAKRVRLDADPQADEVDRYGRLLRNVILQDGMDLNATLVEEGYAHAYLTYPLNKLRKAQLSRLQTEAQAAERGLWNPQTCNGQP